MSEREPRRQTQDGPVTPQGRFTKQLFGQGPVNQKGVYRRSGPSNELASTQSRSERQPEPPHVLPKRRKSRVVEPKTLPNEGASTSVSRLAPTPPSVVHQRSPLRVAEPFPVADSITPPVQTGTSTLSHATASETVSQTARQASSPFPPVEDHKGDAQGQITPPARKWWSMLGSYLALGLLAGLGILAVMFLRSCYQSSGLDVLRNFTDFTPPLKLLTMQKDWEANHQDLRSFECNSRMTEYDSGIEEIIAGLRGASRHLISQRRELDIRSSRKWKVMKQAMARQDLNATEVAFRDAFNLTFPVKLELQTFQARLISSFAALAEHRLSYSKIVVPLRRNQHQSGSDVPQPDPSIIDAQRASLSVVKGCLQRVEKLLSTTDELVGRYSDAQDRALRDMSTAWMHFHTAPDTGPDFDRFKEDLLKAWEQWLPEGRTSSSRSKLVGEAKWGIL